MKKKIHYDFWIVIGPIFLLFIIFYIIPIFMGLYYSFFDWNGINMNKTFIGLDNYIELFTTDKNYFQSIKFSMIFTILNVVISNVISILFAVWVNGKLKSSNVLRTMLFLPNIICAVVIGFLWTFIFNQVSTLMYTATGIEWLNIKWLATPKMALISTLIVTIWQGAGYNMIIYLAGLSSIDKSLYESAKMDGANKFQQFFRVTLPLLMPSITICLFLVTASSFKLFDINLALTRGGPGRATMGMALDIYVESFMQNRMGYGSAKAIVLLVIVSTITLLQVNYTRKKEVEM